MAEDDTKPLEIVSLTIPAQNPLACSMCGKIFSSRRELLVHQWSHRERQTFYCPNCDKNFNNENQFKRHMHVHNKEGKKYVACDICKKIFRNNRILEEHHVQDHTGQKPYRCGTCGIQFSWRENLKKHLHTHIEKPHACMICHESFRDPAGLVIHNKIHKKEMKEQEKREQERREREERERRREQQKPFGFVSLPTPADVKTEPVEDDDEFRCGVCNQSFKYSFTLEAHMKGHEEEVVEVKRDPEVNDVEVQPAQKPITQNPVFEKPHSCHICKQSFRWAFCLDAHLKIHKQGFDAKVQKEKERRLQKKAKERRRLANQQNAKARLGSNAEDVQEGTVVIVVEDLTKSKTAEKGARVVPSDPANEEDSEISSDDMDSEERDVEPEVVVPVRQKRGKKRKVDIQDSDSLSVKAEKVSRETQVTSDISQQTHARQVECQTEIPQEVTVPQQNKRKAPRGRGRARQRGGKSDVNHIDLNEMVASIRKEQEQNFFPRGGCRQRGGMAIRGGPLPQRRVTRSSLRNCPKEEPILGYEEDQCTDPAYPEGMEYKIKEESDEDLHDEETYLPTEHPQHEINDIKSEPDEESISEGEVDESTSQESSVQGEDSNAQQNDEESDDESVDEEAGQVEEHMAVHRDRYSQRRVARSQQGVQTDEVLHEEARDVCRSKDASVQAVTNESDESDDDSDGHENNLNREDDNSSEECMTSSTEDEAAVSVKQEAEALDPESDGDVTEVDNREPDSESEFSDDSATDVDAGDTGGSDDSQMESEYDEGDTRNLEIKHSPVQQEQEEEGSGDDDANNNDCLSSDGTNHSDSTDNDQSDTHDHHTSADSGDSDESLQDEDHDPLELKMKVYSCELCSKAFVQRSSLLAHKKDHHKENGNSSQSDSSGEPHRKVTPLTQKRGRRANYVLDT